MIEIIPAIDIIEGRCVRLTKGDYSTRKTYGSMPLDMALAYADCGVKRIHLVDLDGAKAGAPVNLRTLETIASRTGLELEWGGGLSSDSALESCFNAGATSAIIGSLAVHRPDVMKRWLAVYGPSRIELGADVRNGLVAVRGWLEDSSISASDLTSMFLEDGLNQAVYTEISCDGMLQGPSYSLYTDLMSEFPGVVITASGGISCMDDIVKLDSLSVPRVIVGKAIYEGKIKLDDLKSFCK